MKFNVYLDDERQGPGNKYYNKEYNWDQWVICRHIDQVKYFLENGLVRDLSLDHDLGESTETGDLNPTGSDLVRWMIENNCWPKGEIMIHSQNIIEAQQMRDDIDRFRPK